MTLARIIAIAVLTHMAFVAARMTASLYALANHASTFTVGVIMALFALVPMLIAVRAGRWLDAVGPWRPTLFGTLLMLGGVLLPAAFSYATADVAPLLVAAALIGTGATLTMLSVQQLVGDRADPNRRAAAFSWLALGASISGFSGPVLGGLIIDGFGHRAAFGVLVVVVLLALALVWVNRGLLPARDRRVSGPEPLHPFELLKNTELRHVLIATALVSMSWDLQTFVVPVHGTRVGLSASQIGFVLGCFALATFTIRLAMPWLSRRFTEWQVLTYTLFCATLAFGLFPLFSSLAPLMAVAFLLGLGLGAAQPNVMSLVHSRSPQGRVGEALGLRSTIMHSSHVVLPLVFGAFGSVLGTAAMFWTMATLVCTGGAAAVRWGKHRRTAAHRHQAA
ncbi:MAG TPA: MFS transporter [Burkholderiales bacterium]|nr:MFS transporter [Burkholderiales bacterium]